MGDLLKWNDKYETGIVVIDQQHMQIVAYINVLHKMVKTGEKDGLVELITALVNYTVSHFEYEEMLQKKAQYAFYREHKMSHDIFSVHINRYRVRAASGKDVSAQLLMFLRSWLLGHILKDDMSYVRVVRNVADTSKSKGFMTKIKGMLSRTSVAEM